MSSKTLPGDRFISNYLHPLFGANNDTEMISQMVWISSLYTLSTTITMLVLPAPYGNYIYNISI
jgi:3-oxo-5-alpha-steroid 4-dehydrogenase 1